MMEYWAFGATVKLEPSDWDWKRRVGQGQLALVVLPESAKTETRGCGKANEPSVQPSSAAMICRI